ncbi:MarC family protein [Pyruvatibacter sp.]|uniref:MarC family protein n=1 Tax=Pyruvatibacter sp. TaxID=1981328 RepID=UPI0032649680
MDDIAFSTMLAALFSMMNPLGNVGIFAGMTANNTQAEARAIACKCAIACAVTLLIVIWSGGALMQLFGINVNELRAGGGIIVLLIGLHMLFNKEEHKTSASERADAETKDSIAIVPLAIPIVAGPGTIATALVGAERHSGIWARIDMSLLVVGLCIFIGVLFWFSKPIASWVGPSGMAVVTRIMGMVLVSIAMGMISGGLVALVPALGA